MIYSKNKRIIIIGAGEQGRVIMNYIKNFPKYRIIGFLDDIKTGNVNGIPVLGKINSKLYKQFSYFVAIGNNRFRAEIIERIKRENVDLITIIHPRAIVPRNFEMGIGTSIGAGAIICNDVRIGNGVIIDTGAVIEHDCVLEDYSNVSPASLLVSGNNLGKYTWIGAHSTINEDVNIGKNCIVGAGSVVLKDITDNSLVFGVPAKIKGYVDEQGKHHLKKK